MPSTKKIAQEQSELIHFAVLGLDIQIAELQAKRAQLFALTAGKTVTPVVEAPKARKRRTVSAATRAKLRAAAKARWAREKS